MNIFDKIEDMRGAIQAAQIETADQLEQFRIKYIGSKGEIKTLFKQIKEVPNERKREFGQLVNALKQSAETRFQSLKDSLETVAESKVEVPDLSLPISDERLGSRHPISIVRDQMVDIFKRIGFVTVEGPEIENDWFNFTALNTPADHPARDMQDTFYISKKEDPAMLLRTHTSAAQARIMQTQKPPIRIIVPGRVFRNETISARAHCQFHQVEGLYIAENVSFADLKQTLLYFAREMYGEKSRIQLRPSYFPFTEPSAEMDVSCFICDSKGCAVCKHTGWVEILGCGMVDPAVLEACGIDSEKYTGFAFGIGIERTAMLKYKVNDLRLFFENDVRFLKQFQSVV